VRLIGAGLETLAPTLAGPTADRQTNSEVWVSQGWPPGGLDHLRSGGRLLCLGPIPGATASSCRGFASAFLSAWWSERNNLGTTIAPHPIFAELNHDGYCDFGFRPLLELSPNRLDLSLLSPQAEPLIGAIPGRQGYLFELAVGPGRLLVTSLDLPRAIKLGDPWARYLYARMIQYLGGRGWSQAPRLHPAWLESFRPERPDSPAVVL
jgi:hypothetical protein